MVACVPLPHSGLGPYGGNYWEIVEKDMQILMKEATVTRMEETILKYIGRNCGLKVTAQNELENLRKVFDNESTMSIVPFIAKLVLQLPVLFPGKCLEMLRRREQKFVQLTRLQVG